MASQPGDLVVGFGFCQAGKIEVVLERVDDLLDVVLGVLRAANARFYAKLEIGLISSHVSDDRFWQR